MTEPEGIRLQKVLAAAGVASRRASEILISEGRVEVNGKVVSEQGRRVDPDRDTIIKSDKILNPERTRRTAPPETTEDGGAPGNFDLPPEQKVR